MTSQENGSVYSELKETMKYETDLLKVSENKYESSLYKIRIYLNEQYFDFCVAIGDVKQDKKPILYNYVYIVKYNKDDKWQVISKLGLYEYLETSELNNKHMLIFDNFMDSIKLSSMVIDKYEYISQLSDISKKPLKILEIFHRNKDKKDKKDKKQQLLEKYKGQIIFENSIKYYHYVYTKIIQENEDNYSDYVSKFKEERYTDDKVQSIMDNYNSSSEEKVSSIEDMLSIIYVKDFELLEKIIDFNNIDIKESQRELNTMNRNDEPKFTLSNVKGHEETNGSDSDEELDEPNFNLSSVKGVQETKGNEPDEEENNEENGHEENNKHKENENENEPDEEENNEENENENEEENNEEDEDENEDEQAKLPEKSQEGGSKQLTFKKMTFRR
jgi:hypothetical protein|tara:strand:- start:2206 stop:3372 length:1167 start_codon:yes stop_codon:yes gene_type:complete